MSLAAPAARGTWAYTRLGSLGFDGKASQREAREPISGHGQQQGPLTFRNRGSSPQPVAPRPGIYGLALASRTLAFSGKGE